jgi:anti-sigma B factor antagonist
VSTLDVRLEAGDDVSTVKLSGELDISTAKEVEALLFELEGRADPHRIVVDLSDVSFMDSTGLRLLVTADLRLRREGRELRLVPGPEVVHRVFRLALLEERLTFVDGGRNGEGTGPA